MCQIGDQACAVVFPVSRRENNGFLNRIAMPLNLFLLYHKCGNVYSLTAHKGSDVPLVRSIKREEAESIGKLDEGWIAKNVRCRNFSLEDLKKAGLLESRVDVRFLVFTRHPAGFILSATSYHHRGSEVWARTIPQSQFGGKPLTAALVDARDAAERQIITMRHFRFLYERQASMADIFGWESCMRLRVEELFSTHDNEYFSRIAKFLRVANRRRFVRSLKAASPAYRKDLPKHATGAVKIVDPYAKLEDRAKEYYDEHFSGFARRLGY